MILKKILLTLILLFTTKLVFSQFTIQQNFSNAGCAVIFYVYDSNGIVLTMGGPTPLVPSPSTCISGTPAKVQILYNGSTVGFFDVNVGPFKIRLTCNGIHDFYLDVRLGLGGSLPTCKDILYLTI